MLMADEATALERVFAPNPAPIAGALVAGPYNFQFTGEDNLRLTVANSLAGAVVAVAYRTAPTPTTTQSNKQSFPPTSDRAINTFEFSIGEGYLLNVVAFASSGAPKRGQTFAKLEVIRGLGSAALVLGCVFAGYVTPNQPIAWPGSPIESSTDGDGYTRVIAGTDPAAGAEASETVPPGARWELLDFFVQLATDATVAARRAGIFFDDGSAPYYRSPQPGTVAASAAMDNYWAQGSALETAPLPDVSVANLAAGHRLLAGHRIRTATNNLKAGDNLGQPRYVVREWLEV
jgi:hypothetical protein